MSSLQSPKVHGYPDMEAVPILLSKVKAEPPEDLLSSEQFQTQTEPVDLSINKTRTSSPSSNTSPITSAFSPSSSSSSASSPSVIASISTGMPSVLTPGPLVGSSHGVRGKQFLHIIHPVPPSSPSKLPSQVHRIPVVVQSLPLMYTTAVRSPSTLNSTIMLPLLDEAKCLGKGKDLILDLFFIQLKSKFPSFEKLEVCNLTVWELLHWSPLCPWVKHLTSTHPKGNAEIKWNFNHRGKEISWNGEKMEAD